MKKAISLLTSLILLVCLCGCEEKPAADIGAPIMASFTAMDIAGKAVDQKILSGHKLTMVNVWATFCPPCIQEMPDLGELSSAYGDNFQIIGIIIDAADQNLQPIPAEIAEAKDIIQTTGANYMHLLPSVSLVKAFLANVTSVPTTIFVDEKGNQVGPAYIGAKEKAQWQKIIEDLLKTL